jgi:putative transposase
VHFNPVKHGLVEHLEDWPRSTYYRYVHQGFYGGPAPFKDTSQFDTTDFGE